MDNRIFQNEKTYLHNEAHLGQCEIAYEFHDRNNSLQHCNHVIVHVSE